MTYQQDIATDLLAAAAVHSARNKVKITTFVSAAIEFYSMCLEMEDDGRSVCTIEDGMVLQPKQYMEVK